MNSKVERIKIAVILKRLAVFHFKNIKIFAKFAIAKISKWKRNIGGVCVFTVCKQHQQIRTSFSANECFPDGMFANYPKQIKDIPNYDKSSSVININEQGKQRLFSQSPRHSVKVEPQVRGRPRVRRHPRFVFLKFSKISIQK